MKKILNILCLLFVLILCLTTAYAEKTPLEMPAELTELVEINHAYDEVIEFGEQTFLKMWNKMPEQFQELLIKRKTTIQIGFSTRQTASENGEISQVRRVLGQYIPGNTIEAKIPLGEKAFHSDLTFDDVFYHELGHYVDDIDHNGSFKFSNSKTWKKIPKSEIKMIKEYDHQSWQNSYNNQELFAEAFKIYMLEPEYLIKNAPKTYKVIENAVTETMRKNKIK